MTSRLEEYTGPETQLNGSDTAEQSESLQSWSPATALARIGADQRAVLEAQLTKTDAQRAIGLLH